MVTPKSTVKYSIIIIVKNDRGIDETIQDLKAHVPMETTEIVVIDASGDALKDIQEKYPEVQWNHFVSKTGKKISIPEQRNAGMAAAHGQIIIFVDANCTVEKDWFTELMKPLETENEKIVSGAIWSKQEDNIHNTQNTRNQDMLYLNEAPTMNLAMYREVYDSVGAFNETFDYGSDVDFVTRARDKGYKIRNTPKAILYHDWGDFSDEIKRAFRYGQARINIYEKHNAKIGDLIKSDFITLIYPIFILFLPISIIWPWYWLFLLIPLIKNRNNKPFQTTALNLVFGWGILTKLYEKGRTKR
jgi:glycosyltransferase involved in cell wall biosynthesis